MLPRIGLATALAVSLAWPDAAQAAHTPQAHQIKIAVLDVKASGLLDPKTFEGIAPLFSTEIGEKRPDLQVIGTAEIRTMIGFEKEKQLLGCSDSGCLAEIGGALGVDFLLATDGSELGGTWIVTMSLMDVVRQKAIKRAARRTDQKSKLVSLCLEALHEVIPALPASARAAQPVEPTPSVSASATGSGPAVSRAVSWTLVGVGIAVAAGGAGCLG
ncbi:MAG: hypothetical protein HY901_37925, partial [Deltaproteobacteria bacterium]|nr:hypothetical protein [Deltaproteobacteria bacterium]